jgi:hypothetical protein
MVFKENNAEVGNKEGGGREEGSPHELKIGDEKEAY